MTDYTALQSFLQATDVARPTAGDVEKYLKSRRISASDERQLRRWQVQQENGEIETEYCPTCWAIAVIEPDSPQDGIAFNTCENCYCTVCEFCHRHGHDENPHRCLCPPCAEESRLDAPAHQ